MWLVCGMCIFHREFIGVDRELIESMKEMGNSEWAITPGESGKNLGMWKYANEISEDPRVLTPLLFRRVF